MRAQRISKTTSVLAEASEAPASISPLNDPLATTAAAGGMPGSSTRELTDFPQADRPQVKDGRSGKPGKTKNEKRTAAMRAHDASRKMRDVPADTLRQAHSVVPGSPAVPENLSASKMEVATEAENITGRSRFLMQLQAVTKAAESASLESKETFHVGPFVFLPLRDRRERFHKIFLRDACESAISYRYICSHQVRAVADRSIYV